MSQPNFTRKTSQPPDPGSCPGPGGCTAPNQSTDHTDALWQYLRRIESGLDQIDTRIDPLYVALGGGTVLLAAIGLGSAFIVRGG